MTSFLNRVFIRISLTALSIGICIVTSAAAQPGPGLTLQDRAYLASRVYASLANFAHWQDVPGMDVETAYRGYLEKALAAEDRAAFSRATMEFLAGFHNGHTTLMDQRLIQQGGFLPFTVRFIGAKWVVTEGGSSDLKAGEVIESIDGQPFEQFFSDRRRFISASTEHWARRALFVQLPVFAPYAHLLPPKFSLGLADGRHATIDRSALAPLKMGGTEGRWLEPGKVALIRVPAFFAPEYEKRAVELVREFRNAAVLIVDVRGNIGGSTPGDLTSILMDRPYHWWTESTPITLPLFRYMASRGAGEYQAFDRPDFLWRSTPKQPSKDGFQGQLALLVDAACHSACEDFVMPFKHNGRALLIGETTAGSTGQPYMLDLGNGMVLSVGAKRVMFPDGSRFEGVGIRPDVEISPTVEDIRQGRDVVLEAARKRLAGS